MSPNSQTTSKRPLAKPFLIELWEEDQLPNGHFTPAAAMHLTSSLRTSGLLNQLSPDDLKSLIFVLTFTSPEGHCQPFLSQLSEAMRVPVGKAKARMRRLCDAKWKSEPIVIYTRSASGLSAYSLNPRLVSYRHRKALSKLEPASYAAAPRDAIIQHSRKQYARPRAEVERLIARQMGHDIDETETERKIRYRLENAGLTREQAREIIATYHLDTIAQQLDWLPFRHAKNPAGYLIAAIEGNYSEPRAVREERLFRELRYGEIQAQDAEHRGEHGAEHRGEEGRVSELPDTGPNDPQQTRSNDVISNDATYNAETKPEAEMSELPPGGNIELSLPSDSVPDQ